MSTNIATGLLSITAVTAMLISAVAYGAPDQPADRQRGDERTRIEVAPPVVELPNSVVPTTELTKAEAKVGIDAVPTAEPTLAESLAKQRVGLSVCWQLQRWSARAARRGSVEFRLGQDGHPKDVKVETRAARKHKRKLENCLALKVKEWTLRGTPSKRTKRIRVPL